MILTNQMVRIWHRLVQKQWSVPSEQAYRTQHRNYPSPYALYVQYKNKLNYEPVYFIIMKRILILPTLYLHIVDVGIEDFV
jgi:hypothetical protein